MNHVNVIWIIIKNYDNSKFVQRFFVNCERKFNDLSSIHFWIYAVKVCFIEKTITWINQQSEIQNIFDLKKFDKKNKQRFIALIRKKYSNRKSLIRKQWMIQFKKFNQNEKKSFEQYYRRIHDILKNLDEKNRKKKHHSFWFISFRILWMNWMTINFDTKCVTNIWSRLNEIFMKHMKLLSKFQTT